MKSLSGFCDNRIIDIFNIKSSDILLEDIINTLPNICRYNGLVGEGYYSVAQHCYELSEIFPTVELKQAALLHDAVEIFTGDLIYPIKEICPEFIALEDRILKLIFRKFNVNYDLLERIKTFDRRICLDEMKALNIGIPEWFNKQYKPLEINIVPLSPKQSREVYKSYINRYFK